MTSTIRRAPAKGRAKAATRSKSSAGTKRPSARTTPAKRSPAKKATTAGRSTGTRSTTARKTPAKRSTAAGRSATARKTTAKRSATAKKAGTKKKATARKAPAKRSTTAGRSATARETTAKRSATAKKAGTKKKATARKAPAKRSTTSAAGRAPATARRHQNEPAPAGFRSNRSTRVKRGKKGSKRRSSPPATDAGERNAAFLTATVLGLTLFGLVMVLSASSVSSLHEYADSPFSQFKRQATWAGFGAVAFMLASWIDYRRLRPLATPMLLIIVAMLVALLIPGVGITANSSTRWLGIGPLVIQPSELAKLVFIIFVADLLTRRERRMDRPELTVRPVMLILGLLSGLMILQPKLGTPIIMGAVTMLILFVAGARMKSLLTWLTTAILIASFLAYMAPYRRARVLSFLNPWESPDGIGLQAIQSQVGIASGGLFGVGLGASRAKWGFLPFAHTDFIFAIVAEEVGLIGASALIGAFLLIAWFGFKAAIAAPDRFGSLLAAGITSWLLVQAFLNIGMVLGVLPITGEPLPFVSAGGSSLVTTLAAAGLLTNVSRRGRGWA